jgi:hypothetical protein
VNVLEPQQACTGLQMEGCWRVVVGVKLRNNVATGSRPDHGAVLANNMSKVRR